MRIGFVGLGQMGHGIAANLLAAGHELTVWNRSAERAAVLAAAGARVAATPADAAGGELVFSMLADDAAVEATVFGDGGLLAAPAGAIHVSLSTISVDLSERLTAAHRGAGGDYVAAPVFGRPAAAAAAKLFVVAAGSDAAVERCRPAFDAIAQRSFVVGETPSAANAVKLGGNFLIMSVVESLAEAMVLVERHGVPRATFLEILTGSLFDAPIYRNYGQMLVDGVLSPGRLHRRPRAEGHDARVRCCHRRTRADAGAVAGQGPAARDDRARGRGHRLGRGRARRRR